MKRAAQRKHVGRPSALPDSERLAGLRDLYPEAFAEGKVDFDKLRGLLGGEVDDRPERYSFSWAGKRDAIRLLQTPSRAALVPCPEESIDFETSRNVFIEGENLEVLKLLYKSYFGRVKMIYIDPPYNTGHDFIYPDNYADPLATYLQLTGQQDSAGNLLTSNPETSGRYHSAWLSMMYPRLFLARQLLREDGVIFISIDDHEVHNLRMVMNEIFGEENFVDTLVWKKRYGGGAKEKYLVSLHEYIVFYARDKESLSPLFVPTDPESIEKYYKFTDDNYSVRGPYRTHPLEATKSMGERKNLTFPIAGPDGSEIWPKRQWLWSRERVAEALSRGELLFVQGRGGWTVHTKQYLKDEKGEVRSSKAFSIIDDVYTQHGTNEIIEMFGDAQVFPFPKPTGLMKSLLRIGTSANEDDIVLDLFAGSCSSAQAVGELNRGDGGNRRSVSIQLPEPTGRKDFRTIADIGKERIRRVLAKLRSENAGQLTLPSPAQLEDLGFRVFKLAPSKFAPWTGEAADTDAYARQLELQTDPLVEGWKPQDVMWEVAVREGFGLDAQVVPVAGLEAQAVWRVSEPAKEQSFFLCLADRIDLAALRPLNLGKEDLFICRDAALDDEVAANLALQCRLKTI